MSIPATSFVLQNLYDQYPSISPTITQSMLYTITSGTGNVITLFTRTGASPNYVFTRTCTTVPLTDGTYATGTTLSNTTAVYAALSAGNPYYGTSVLFGKKYEAYYWVIDATHAGFVGVAL